jgi:hypothetical protein
MAAMVWLLEISAIIVCLLAGVVAFSILLCMGIAAVAAKRIGPYVPNRLGVFELNEGTGWTNRFQDEANGANSPIRKTSRFSDSGEEPAPAPTP